MMEDAHLEMAYEDRATIHEDQHPDPYEDLYTTRADWDMEDESDDEI
jgi:hypothetical protein